MWCIRPQCFNELGKWGAELAYLSVKRKSTRCPAQYQAALWCTNAVWWVYVALFCLYVCANMYSIKQCMYMWNDSNVVQPCLTSHRWAPHGLVNLRPLLAQATIVPNNLWDGLKGKSLLIGYYHDCMTLAQLGAQGDTPNISSPRLWCPTTGLLISGLKCWIKVWTVDMQAMPLAWPHQEACYQTLEAAFRDLATPENIYTV